MNLLRESAFLQLQLRNYPPMVEKQVGAVEDAAASEDELDRVGGGTSFGGSLEAAVRVLEGYENVMRDIPARNYEHSEVLLYHASILEELSRYQDALDLIENGTSASSTSAASRRHRRDVSPAGQEG